MLKVRRWVIPESWLQNIHWFSTNTSCCRVRQVFVWIIPRLRPLSWHLNAQSPSWGIPSELLNATPVLLEAMLHKRAQLNVLFAAWASMPTILVWPPATNVLRMQRNLTCGPLARKSPQTLGAASWRFISQRSVMFWYALICFCCLHM